MSSTERGGRTKIIDIVSDFDRSVGGVRAEGGEGDVLLCSGVTVVSRMIN